MNKINLLEYGLKDCTKNEFEKLYNGLYLGRVICQLKNYYKVITEKGVINAKACGKLIYKARTIADFPAVGDWVILNKDNNAEGDAVIYNILTRYSKFSRKVCGNKDDEQIIAANIDIIFITMSLNNNFNLRRLERYISAAYDSGAKPVILLTKCDLCDNIEQKIFEISNNAAGIDIFAVSSFTNYGLDEVKNIIFLNKTAVFAGSSGIGKSTIINKFIGYDKMKISDIREIDGRGRHTTTYRELIKIPNGGLVIDTPGMREFQIMDVEDGVCSTFEDIEQLAEKCKFRNCNHGNEPGCAVKKAITDGILSDERYQSYLKLLKQSKFMANKEKIKKSKMRKTKR